MALVNIESAPRRILQILKKQPVNTGLEVLTYKRNRGLSIIKEANDFFWIRERGYFEEEKRVGEGELPKVIKSILKRECPRSRKVRIYSLSSPDEVGSPRKKL